MNLRPETDRRPWRFGKGSMGLFACFTISVALHLIALTWTPKNRVPSLVPGTAGHLNAVGTPIAVESYAARRREPLVTSRKEPAGVPERKAEEKGDGRGPVSRWGAIADAVASGYLKGNYVHPEYPRLARKRKEEGSALIGIRVAHGNLDEVGLVQSSGFPLLDEAAMAAIKMWSFEEHINVSFVQRVTFRLGDG